MTQIEVYDIETLFNCFTYTGFDCTTKRYYQFVIHEDLNQIDEFYNHLKRGGFVQIGYNNEAFDYPVIHYILRNYQKLSEMTPDMVTNRIYNEAQRVINSEEYNNIADKNKIIPQFDLYLIWHYNNKARATSLKDLQFAMNMLNIEDMPIPHNSKVNKDDIQLILDYNKNDVEATYKFLLTTLGKVDFPLYKGKDKIALRGKLQNKFNINCKNYSDVKLGEQLMLQLYSRATEQNSWDVKQLRSKRPIIYLRDCVPSWCNILSREFNTFLDSINQTSIDPISDKFSCSSIFHGIKFDFGLGGVHGCIKPGVYKAEGKNIILDLDVASLYPSIAKSLNLYPEHLGIEFIQLYSKFIDERLQEKSKPKSEQDSVLIEGYKLILNGSYGKSNEQTSFLYDPLYTFKTTIAGQLFIAMWAERMVNLVPELEFIQINTDGITIRLPEDKLPLIREVNQQLTKETTLEIEEAFYNQMIIRDVNNYIGEYVGSTKEKEYVKYKGCFEVDKEYHKDSSMRVVPLALKEYFLYGVPIEETIRNHKNIYDFCLRLKLNSISKGIQSYLCYKDNPPVIKEVNLTRTTRYYISNKGGILTVYYNKSNRPNKVNKGFNTTLFNKFVESDNYDINYKFYEIEARKILNVIVNNQLSLF